MKIKYMKINLILSSILVILMSLFYSISLAQNIADYNKNIRLAEKFYLEKEYRSAANLYSTAFTANGNRGTVRDRYEAARCWSLAGIPDSAFLYLTKISQAGFTEFDEIIQDTAFNLFNKDVRWPKIVDSIKSNFINQDKDVRWQFKKLNKPVMAILDTIYHDDQNPRNLLQKIIAQKGESDPQIQSINLYMHQKDSINREKVKKIISEFGWLGKNEVGQQGNQTLFLVIQHSDLATQIEYLPIMRNAMKEGKMSSASFAIFEDRVALQQGKEQIYGSQIAQLGNGKFYVLPMIDPINVDERRAQARLIPISEYLKKFNIIWSIKRYKKDLLDASKAQ